MALDSSVDKFRHGIATEWAGYPKLKFPKLSKYADSSKQLVPIQSVNSRRPEEKKNITKFIRWIRDTLKNTKPFENWDLMNKLNWVLINFIYYQYIIFV
jgi:hypothetical protein